MARKPIYFKTEKELTDKWFTFIDGIVKDGYARSPSYTGFARSCGCSVDAVLDARDRYPTAKKVMAETYADLIVEGAMVQKRYQPIVAIFTLKNRCGWTDKKETTNITGDDHVATPEEAKMQIKRVYEDMQDSKKNAREMNKKIIEIGKLREQEREEKRAVESGD